MSDAAWRVEFAPVAAKEFRRLDPPVRRRVLAALDRLAVGDPALDVKRLKGGVESRLRVGDWRVRFRRDEAARLSSSGTSSLAAVHTTGDTVGCCQQRSAAGNARWE